jgi:hypothetical protein
MAIDAVIKEVKRKGADLVLFLGPRIGPDGSVSIPGQPRLTIRGFNWVPVVGQEIWGGADSCIIEPNERITERRHYRRDAAGRLREVKQEIPIRPEAPILMLEVSDIHVSSYSAGKIGDDVPATEVHLLYKIPGLEDVVDQFMMRFKSREAIEPIIAALIEHRDYVWPEGGQTNEHN